MRSKKLKALFCVYAELIDELGKINDSKLHYLVDSWVISLRESQNYLDDPDIPIKPSQLVSGFEQGLLETPQLLVELPEQCRAGSIKIFYSVVQKHIPELFDKHQKALKRVVTKGIITNKNDWYLVRGRMDVIEGLHGSEEEFEMLDKLLLEYERGG